MLNYILIQSLSIILFEQTQTVIVLTIVVIFFAVLLILGVRKSYKLKKENERLDKISEKLAKEDEEKYEDFTDGHMYQ
ncbi:hypothetical protein [Confluentibacter flavum]|uniref:Uncharacterized protein n=1 Tax=Confluentibacter flavum TaxID=1909700 RepID=A0A2N3HNN9_9FLAO|nr:hypothetical protein [Confluentibacter flavum]PKQ46580.1 hypothetical protein CSW08_02120 [Confluentibacter flavum]